MPITIIDTIKPKNGGKFPIVEAQDVSCGDARLSELLPVCLTQAEYDALAAAGTLNPKTPYFIKKKDGDGS